MKITDINCSLGCIPGVNARFTDADGLIRAMDTYRIDRAVFFHTEAQRDAVYGNQQAFQTAQNSADRLQACYILRPDLGSAEMPSAQDLLLQLREQRPAAVKLYPNAHRFTLNEFYSGELLEVLNELRMPVLFDADQKPPYEALPKLATDYPGIKFVLLKVPHHESRHTRPLLKKLSNVFVDVGIMIDTCLLEEIVNQIGSEKLLFGSGMPIFMPAGSLGMVIYSRIPESDREAILSGNWNRIQEEIKWA